MRDATPLLETISRGAAVANVARTVLYSNLTKARHILSSLPESDAAPYEPVTVGPLPSIRGYRWLRVPSTRS